MAVSHSTPPAPGRVAVLLPAAGEGRRMGGRRKQFRLLGGEALLVQTLRVFEEHPAVHYIFLAAPPEACAPLEAELRASHLLKLQAVVPGGATRQASVAAALKAVPDEVEIVLVHDAVRPFVTHEQIDAVIEAADVHGAASLAIPVTDTVRKGDGQVLGETVPRHDLYRMQTPQGFRRDWLAKAHTRFKKKEATDDVELVQRLGHAVQIVPGSTRNIKITTPEDWALAQVLWTLEAQP